MFVAVLTIWKIQIYIHVRTINFYFVKSKLNCMPTSLFKTTCLFIEFGAYLICFWYTLNDYTFYLPVPIK